MYFPLRTWIYTLGTPRVATRVLEACILLTLVTVTTGERSWIASQRHIMPAGDVFNFQSIARNIRHFQYPLREKRLPGFPLALLIGMEAGFDPTLTGVAISVLASGGITALLYLLGRRLGMPKLPLALMVLLTSVAPLLTINGVRPLSDSYFLFLFLLAVYVVTSARPTRSYALSTGLVLALLAFTRYEGIPTALLLLPLLRFHMPWRLIGLAAAPLVIAGLLWLPVAKHIYGSFREFGYIQDAREIASISKVPREYVRIVKAAGWGDAKNLLYLWDADETRRLEARENARSWSTFLSVIGLLGFVFFIAVAGRASLPVLLTFAVYPILPAWWFTYSRYVAPIEAMYFLSLAAGASLLWIIVGRLFRHRPPARLLAYALLAILFIKAVLGAAPGMFSAARGRGFENNGNGYALFLALQSLKDRTEHVAVSFDYLMASMMLGTVDGQKDALNEGRGIYLSAWPNASPEELASHLEEKKAEILVDGNEERIRDLVAHLRARGVITRTESFTFPRRDGETDRAALHYLNW